MQDLDCVWARQLAALLNPHTQTLCDIPTAHGAEQQATVGTDTNQHVLSTHLFH
jgi:hypothetical protein